MLFRFRPPQDAEHSRPLDDCVSWWRDRRDHLLAYARLKALDDLDAEDLLAESVKRIIRAVADKRLKPEPDELTPYAFTVIRNTAIDWRKKRSNRLNVEQAYVLDPTVREDALFSLPEDTDHLHRELQKRLAQLPAELAEIISADYERMKGKWIRLRNEAGREFRICLDDLAPDDIDHLLDWKEHNGIRTWEYVAESGRPGFASPPFDGMLVDTRPQEDGSLEAVIRKTNGDIRIMPAKWQDTETRQYAAAWKHPSPMKEDNEKLRTFLSWRQARARSECANIPAVAFVLGKKGGPEAAEFKKQILGKPEEIARLNRTSAVVVCYHGQWDSCGREVFLQLHFVRKGTDPDGNMPPEYLYSSGFIWSSTDNHNYIAPQFRVRRKASPRQEEFRRALKEKRLMQVRALLNKDRTLAAAIFPDTHYSAIQTAMEESTPEIVSLLLDHGARVNAVTPNGVPILMAAGIRGKKEMVRLLLERGADPNLPCITSGSETYVLSYCHGNADIMKLLLDAGASLNKSPGLPFDVLSGIRTPQALQLLKPYGITLQTRSVDGDTALKNAICRGDTEQVKFYLEQGADANEADRNGLVPLYHAIGIKGKPEITNLLIEHGANVNAVYKGTVSMLDHARNRHGAAQEKLLLKHGAKTAAELKKQQNASPSGPNRNNRQKLHDFFLFSPFSSTEASGLLKNAAGFPCSDKT